MSFYSGWNPGPNEINGTFAIDFSGAKISPLMHMIYFSWHLEWWNSPGSD